MITCSDKFKEAMRAPVKTLSAEVYFPDMQAQSKNLAPIAGLSYSFRIANFADVNLPAGTYTISAGKIIPQDASNFKGVAVIFKNNNGENIATSILNSRQTTVVLQEEAVALTLYSNGASEADSQEYKTTLEKFQIEAGNMATEYQPHKGLLVRSTDNLCSMKLNATGRLFLASAKSATIQVLGQSYGNAVGQNAIIYVGVETDSTTHDYENICLGFYGVRKQSVNLEKGMTVFEVLDTIGTMGEHKYNADEITFPCTVKTLIAQMAELNGVTIAPGLDALPNINYSMKENLWKTINGVTYRDVLDQVAGATGSTINMSGEVDTATLRPAQLTSQETLTYKNLRKVKYGRYYGDINTVTLSRQPQEDNVTVQDQALVDKYGVHQAKLSNNEILDDDRQILAKPILDAVKGYGYYRADVVTEGHLWYEIGDRLTLTDGTNSWDVVVTSIEITIDGGIKETLKCEAPEDENTNYATTGSIYKSIWNTEIKVDKQGNQITSVVQRQDQTDGKIEQTFTKVEQDIKSITSSVQTVGGGNLVKNSVGYATNASNKLSFWTTPDSGVSAVSSPGSISYGAISGNEIDLASGVAISQRVAVAVQAGAVYSLSAFVKKPTVGSASIRAYNDVDDFVIDLADGDEYIWKKVVKESFTPSMTWLTIEVENTNAQTLAVTDLMFSATEKSAVWQQASSEILNTQVALTEDGVKVQSSVHDGDYVEITPLEFAGYSDASGRREKVFSLNRDVTKVTKIDAEKQIYMNPIKVIPITSGDRQGWAFVKSTEG